MSNYIYSTGKRKTSIARVFLKEGDGEIIINNNSEQNPKFITIIKKTLMLLNINNKIDLKITVKGGGLTGQSEAIRHGLSKALVILDKKNINEENSFRKKLKKLGFLTRDSRKVERKKVGRRKARKKEQYSKR
ncbi:30S ribosomal protein S9 [Candidatus Azoamicus ciliaticola]|uniref:30S ribosomal protein S9 n=1 Tax=Candidatus Azoamicus ciliaticola TaxID=2652803 RepID=A0A6J5JYD2_9GAMM|nr:30S ribosomal protein S9 [Candidatus Azoamicus ciliaticola]CAB3976353.1 30S ribosomal protein S9 [Candidatus Azoamicus ciliaticola]